MFILVAFFAELVRFDEEFYQAKGVRALAVVGLDLVVFDLVADVADRLQLVLVFGGRGGGVFFAEDAGG